MSMHAAAAASPPAFAPIAHDLRGGLIEHYERRRESLDTAAGLVTLDTNSMLAARRGRLLLRLLAEDGAGPVAGRTVLDLGAGFGALALYCAHLGAEVVAVDPNEERLAVSVEIAQRRGLAVSPVIAHAQSLPLADASVDLVIANNSLCYIVEKDSLRLALSEILRVLRPGGRLIVRNPNRVHPRDPFTGLPLLGLLSPGAADRVVAAIGRHRSQVRLYSPGGAVRLLRRAGFSEVRRRAQPGRGRSLFAAYHHVLARRPDPAPEKARRVRSPGS
jgi:SAM-dependent methyltransferase